MSKIVAAGVMALFIGTTAAYAQAPSAPAPGAQSATDAAGFTDVRIAVIKAALQLTPDQEKLTPRKSVASILTMTRIETRPARQTAETGRWFV